MVGLILALMANLAGIVCLLSAYRYYRYSMQWRHEDVPSQDLPRVTVISPHRGPIIRKYVDALTAQDYEGAWNVIFVTTHEDASYPQLVDCAKGRVNVQIALADDVVQLAKDKGVHRGQKNHNLVTALSQMPCETEVIAVIDSDVHPSPDWLKTLVQPLCHAADAPAVTTLARFYVPGLGLASQTQAVWIMGSVAFMVGPWCYVWGGSFAMRRDILDTTDILDRWRGLKGSISSDDLNLSAALKLAGRRVAYVPGYKALTNPPSERETWSDVLRFTNRQLLHTWWSHRSLWIAAFMTESMKSIALLSALSIAWFQPAALWALCVLATDMAGSALVVHSLRSLDPSNRKFLRSLQGAAWTAPLASMVCLVNTIAAVMSKSMKWAGVEYTYRTVLGYTRDHSWRLDTGL
jgi:cellulose synthase/poly-beta-1,6-N-acetylglucosamine synthase-like glycosyltransferase